MKELSKINNQIDNNDTFINMFNTNNSIMLIVDPTDGKIVNANKSACDFYGYSRKSFIEKLYIKDINILSEEKIKFEIKNVLKNKKSYFNFTHQLSNKEIREVEVNSNKISYNGKEHLFSIIYDITDIKESEKLLLNSKKYSEKLLNISAGIIIALDTNGNITLLNDSGYKLLGFKKGALMGKNWFVTCIPMHLRSEIKTVFNQLMSGNVKNIHYYENSIKTRKGDEKIIRWHNNLLYDNDKKIVGLISSGQNITDIKKAELALIKSENRYKNLTKNAVDIIYRYKFYPKPGFDYISPAVTAISGYTPKDHYDDPYLRHKIIHPEDKQQLVELENGFIPKALHIARWIRKDGKIIWIEDRNKTVLDDNGNVIEIEGIARDITEQVLAQNALKESEEIFASLFNTSPNLITISNIEDGTIIDINDTGLTQLGYKKSEVIGKTSIELGLLNKEQRAMIIEPLHKNRSYSEIEIPITLRTGEVRTGLFYGQLINLAGKEYLFQTIVDISRLKTLEKEVLSGIEKYQVLYDNAPDMYFSVDKTGTILSVNQNGAKYLGYTKNDLIGNKVWKIIHKKDLPNVKEQINNILKECKKYHEINFRKVKGDGSIIFVKERIQCFYNAKNNTKELRMVCRDITENRKIRQKLLDYQQNLKTMTHEIVSIEEKTKRKIAEKLHDNIGQSLALSKITLSDISEDKPFKEIQTIIDKAKSLITDAIKQSRNLTYELSPPILHELGLEAGILWYTDQIKKIFDIKFQFHGFQNKIKLSEDMKILIYKSATELINNIVKHSNASIVTISITQFNDLLKITINDNGIGFKKSQNYQLSKDKKFGLFSVNERIKYLGGNFQINSKINFGTKVTIKIPV